MSHTKLDLPKVFQYVTEAGFLLQVSAVARTYLLGLNILFLTATEEVILRPFYCLMVPLQFNCCTISNTSNVLLDLWLNYPYTLFTNSHVLFL